MSILNVLEFPELQALLRTMALIMCGTTLIPARSAAITNGDCAAVPVLLSSNWSLEGTRRVIIKIETTGQPDELVSTIDFTRSTVYRNTKRDRENMCIFTVEESNSNENSFRCLGMFRRGAYVSAAAIEMVSIEA